jgi:predicted flavoprotein YhiN
MVEAHGIACPREGTGQLFCDESSKLILRMLLDECAQAACRSTPTARSNRCRPPNRRRLPRAASAGNFHAESLVVASGGLSIPSLGGSGFGYDLARQFGHALLPLARRAGAADALSGKHLEHYADLAGVALPVSARTAHPDFGQGALRQRLLFTHRGISGPSILQAEQLLAAGAELRVDLSPARRCCPSCRNARPPRRDGAAQRARGSAAAPARAPAVRAVPARPPMRQLNAPQLREIAARLHDWPIVASGTEGYRTAEVTLAASTPTSCPPATMQSKLVPGCTSSARSST